MHAARSLIIAVAGLSLTAGVEGHFSKFEFSSTHYYFRFWGLPDFDQVRTDLANDGKQFCVPTSAIDWLGYFANHGSPVLGINDVNWEAQANYDLATFYIASMADCNHMCTDAFGDGTTLPDSVNGLRVWLGDGWVVSSWIRDFTWSPDFEFIASMGMNGSHMIPGVGWYYQGAGACLDRDGGHAFALAGAHRDDNTFRFDIHDPASDDDEVAEDAVLQSGFTTDSYYLVPLPRNPDCQNPAWHERDMWQLAGLYRLDDNNNVKYGYLDYLRAIFPQFIATAIGSDDLTYVALEIDGGLEPVRSFTTFGGDPIVDVELGADLGHTLVVVGTPGDTQLWVHTPGFDRWDLLDFAVDTPTDVASGRHREAYVITEDGTRLICFDVDTYEVEADVTLPAQAQALVYDDTLDEVVVLSLPEHAIMRYARGLEDPPMLLFPDDLPFGDEASMGWDPTDGAVWIIVDGDPLAYRLTDVATQPMIEVVDLPGILAPEAIGVSDYGRVFVSDEGVVKEYVRDGNGPYGLAADPFFAGREAGHVLSVARSRTNYEPELVDDSWYDEVPNAFAEGVPACREDIDDDGLVSVSDLLAMLAAWGTPDAFADLAPDGGDLNVDVLDLLALLGAWGPCPGAP